MPKSVSSVCFKIAGSVPLLPLLSVAVRVSGCFGKEWLTKAESESTTTNDVPGGMQDTVGRHNSAIRCGRLGHV
jgi:hypothetical protein